MIPGSRIVAPKGGRRKPQPVGVPPDEAIGIVASETTTTTSAVVSQPPQAHPSPPPSAAVGKNEGPRHVDAAALIKSTTTSSSVTNAATSSNIVAITAFVASDLGRLIRRLHDEATPTSSPEQQQQQSLTTQILKLLQGNSRQPSATVVPRGLINASNHCFLNAVTQSMTCLTPFVRIATQLSTLTTTQQHPKGAHPHDGTMLRDMAPTWCAFGKWCEQLSRPSMGSACIAGPRIPFLMTPSVSSSAAAHPQKERKLSFDGRTQQDAHEFLMVLLETLREELCTVEEATTVVAATTTPAVSAASAVPTAVPTKTKQKSKNAAAPEEEDGRQQQDADNGRRWITVGKGNEKLQVSHSGLQVDALARGGHDALWRLLFGGELHNLVKGGKSTARGVTSVTKEPFLCIALPVEVQRGGRGGGPPTVVELLEASFGVREFIDDDVRQVEMSRAQQIGALPHILIVQLKRWAVTAEGDVVKLDNIVRVPAELTVPVSACSVAITGAGGKGAGYRQYTLQSVVCHRGGGGDSSATLRRPAGGHYVSYVSRRTAPLPPSSVTKASSSTSAISEEPWWLCNDMKITSATHGTMENDTPYLLFYQRR